MACFHIRLRSTSTGSHQQRLQHSANVARYFRIFYHRKDAKNGNNTGNSLLHLSTLNGFGSLAWSWHRLTQGPGRALCHLDCSPWATHASPAPLAAHFQLRLTFSSFISHFPPPNQRNSESTPCLCFLKVSPSNA